MFTNIRGINGVIGVMLFLIAIYLVLEKAGGASSLIGATADGGSKIFKTLQGR